jgi:hypothetical protein
VLVFSFDNLYLTYSIAVIMQWALTFFIFVYPDDDAVGKVLLDLAP